MNVVGRIILDETERIEQIARECIERVINLNIRLRAKKFVYK